MRRPGLRSSSSTKMPSRVIFALTLRSAEHDTAIPTGHEAPWRGSRMTRTSWAKYFPPNWAPIPSLQASSSSFFSSSRSRNAWPCSFPWVGSSS